MTTAQPLVHDWRIEEREYARQEQRRGRRHAYEHLDPHPTALVVVDVVPFFVEDNPYADLLTERGVDTVLVAGTVTNVCCESSARDASTLGYRVVMVADANATLHVVAMLEAAS